MEKLENVIEVCNLEINFYIYVGEVKVICDVSFDLCKGEILVIVGELGFGKLVMICLLMGLLVFNVEIKCGSIMFYGEDIIKKFEKDM